MWAKINREAVADKLISWLGFESYPEKIIDCSHNYLEKLDNKFIHRKGATTSMEGMVVIPGSRGTLTYIVKPIGDGVESAHSISHGAGRKWARSLCKSRIKDKYNRDSIRHTSLKIRIYHKRKNWFIDISKIDKENTHHIDEVNKSHIRFETFRCGGKGGQNVNKVETGVKVIHIPTGLSVTSTTGRTQAMNKKLAIDRLIEVLVKKNKQYDELLKEMKWLEHEKIKRGDAFAVYVGMDFKKISKNTYREARYP